MVISEIFSRLLNGDRSFSLNAKLKWSGSGSHLIPGVLMT